MKRNQVDLSIEFRGIWWRGKQKTSFDLVMNGLRDPMKQTKAHETSFKQPENEIRLSPKLILRSKKDKTKVWHKRGRHLQKQNRLANLGDEVNMGVSILDMLRKIAWSVKARIMRIKGIMNWQKMQRGNHTKKATPRNTLGYKSPSKP